MVHHDWVFPTGTSPQSSRYVENATLPVSFSLDANYFFPLRNKGGAVHRPGIIFAKLSQSANLHQEVARSIRRNRF
jgi:hypothetical protein